MLSRRGLLRAALAGALSPCLRFWPVPDPMPSVEVAKSVWPNGKFLMIGGPMDGKFETCQARWLVVHRDLYELRFTKEGLGLLWWVGEEDSLRNPT